MKKLSFFMKIGGVIAALLFFTSCDDDDSKDTRYRVTVNANENGTAVADLTEAAAGERVTLKATANEGFVFSTWTVEEGKVELADAAAAETHFTMPGSDVVVKAEFVEEGMQQYADILPLLKDEFFKEYVQYRMEYPERINEKNYPAWDLNTDGKLSSEEAAKVAAILMPEGIISGENQIIASISLEDLQYFRNVETLILDWNDVTGGLEVFTKLKKLTYLSFQYCYMPEDAFVDLSHCPELTTALFEQNYLSRLDVSKCSNLAELNLNDVSLDELDLSASTMLTHLEAVYAPISKLDLSHCTALQLLDLNNCSKLTDLKLPQSSRLTSLSLTNTRISELDATQYPLLVSLSCGKNPNLKQLDVSKCTKLKTLICHYSPIGKLDLSHCPDIDLVWTECCHLTEINLKGCTKLFELYCEQNNLTEVDVTDLGFYFDEGKETNTYLLHCGQQVLPGTEPGMDSELSLKHELWNPLSQPVTLRMRQNQKAYWDSSLQGVGHNYKVDVVVVD